MTDLNNTNNTSGADQSLATAHGSRWGFAERYFDPREMANKAFVGWIMQHVRMSPFTLKLHLRDGEAVRTTRDHGGGMKIEIRFENK
jgi:hypothetical protein